MKRQLDYFAYGSNMHLMRLRQRVPSCELSGVAELRAHLLRFHKRSPDGSGKCNIVRTGENGDRVFGVLYRIAANEKALLDNAEGVCHGYNVHYVNVTVAGRACRAYTYIADPNYLDETLLPYGWYKELVVTGARMHGLPTPYIAKIDCQKALPDADAERDKLHRQIILTLPD